MAVNKLRIVPIHGQGVSARGTIFMVGEEQLSVQSVTIKADAEDGIWRATITCLAELEGEIVAELEDGS